MSLTTDNVKKVAHLARLSFNESEINTLTDELGHILQFIEHMNQINTNDVLPLAHPLEATQPLRPDLITEPNQRELFLKNAPQTLLGLYIVPQVLENEG